MSVSTAREVFDSFEASFQDKSKIPEGLELLWLKKAVAQYEILEDRYLSRDRDKAFHLSGRHNANYAS